MLTISNNYNILTLTKGVIVLKRHLTVCLRDCHFTSNNNLYTLYQMSCIIIRYSPRNNSIHRRQMFFIKDQYLSNNNNIHTLHQMILIRIVICQAITICMLSVKCLSNNLFKGLLLNRVITIYLHSVKRSV